MFEMAKLVNGHPCLSRTVYDVLNGLPATVPVDLIASILNSPPTSVRVTIRGNTAWD